MGLMSRAYAALRDAGKGPLPDLAIMLRDRLAEAPAGEGLDLTLRERAAYDRLIDGLNRLPRPIMALGTVALIATALVCPTWFAARMDALSAMPDALWWLIGGVISLYFGARFQTHEQEFQREMVEAIVKLPTSTIPPLAETPLVATTGTDAALALAALQPGPNAALPLE